MIAASFEPAPFASAPAPQRNAPTKQTLTAAESQLVIADWRYVRNFQLRDYALGAPHYCRDSAQVGLLGWTRICRKQEEKNWTDAKLVRIRRVLPASARKRGDDDPLPERE